MLKPRRRIDQALYTAVMEANVQGISKRMGAREVTESYHDLWRVEQSFRMSKTDLRERPMFHHTATRSRPT